MLTYRDALYVRHRLAGKTQHAALKLAGFSSAIAEHPERVVTQEMLDTVARLQAELVNHALACGLADAKELHEACTDRLRGDVADLYDDAGELKPISEWPWWARNGGVEITDAPNMVPSKDGDSASWDQVGRKKIVKTLPREKAWEMLGKLKAVDAFKEQSKGDLHVHLHEQQRIREKLVSARKRYAKVIEAQATPLHIEDTANATGCSALTEGLVVDNKEDE